MTITALAKTKKNYERNNKLDNGASSLSFISLLLALTKKKQVNFLGSRSRLSLDVQCPTDDVSVASLLSDIDHAVSMALGGGGGSAVAVPGPVHLNFMFRENLAPVAGAIRY